MPNFGAWLLEGMPWQCSRLKTPACHSGCFSSKLSETSHQFGLVNISAVFWSSNENREKLWCLQTLYPTTHLTPCFSATPFSQCLLMPKGCKVQNLRPTEASRKLFPVTVRPGAGWSKREILVSLFLSLKQQQQQQLKKNPKNSCQKTRTSEKKKP